MDYNLLTALQFSLEWSGINVHLQVDENFIFSISSVLAFFGIIHLPYYQDSMQYVMLIFLQDPVRSAVINSCIRVTDNGRESIQRKVRSLSQSRYMAEIVCSDQAFLINCIDFFIKTFWFCYFCILPGRLHIHSIQCLKSQ